MKGIAFSSMRVGKKYCLINYGDKNEFVLTEVLGKDYRLCDLHTMELYLMSDLIQYGKGQDFELKELD